MDRARMTARLALVTVVALGLAASPALAESTGLGSDETNAAVLSPLSFWKIAQPDPVLGADGKVHLAYELLVVNQSSSTFTLTSVDVIDPAKQGAVLETLQGNDLAARLNHTGDVAKGTTSFPPSTTAYLFLDVQLDPKGKVPSSVAHHFTMSVVPPPGTVTTAQVIEFDGVRVDVNDTKAVVVTPPLRGSGWVVGNGCCDAVNAHRGATLSIDGTVHAAERFAIDFVQLGPNHSLVQGDPTKNESFGYFGDEVHAAANGKVVAVQDDQPEGVPGALPPGQTVQTAGGNYVVEKLGDGKYAFYAHLQPGSVKVKVGDVVKVGEVVGLLGNTGNSNAPHLHFHVMDGPSPLLSNGLPFVFTRFTGEGVVTDQDALEGLTTTPVDTSALAGPHRIEMPLNLEVVGFGS